jgi:hypothetical protein
VPSAQLDNLVIEYSTDNVNWTAVDSYSEYAGVVLASCFCAILARIYSELYMVVLDPDSLLNLLNERDGQTILSPHLLPRKNSARFEADQPSGSRRDDQASYAIEYPFKTANNLLRFTCSIQLQRG